MTEEHINLAQLIIKRQFPDIIGLQDTLFSQTDAFKAVITDKISVRIHFINSHWVTSCSINGSILLYDSMYNKLDSHLINQLARCYKNFADYNCEFPPSVVVNIKSVQQQTGSLDCGLFAIANAVHLAFGKQPETISYNQNFMRQHLEKMFHARQFKPFPLLNKRSKLSITRNSPSTINVQLHCTCLMPCTYGFMVACSKCLKWFHITCVQYKEDNSVQEWNCEICIRNMP